MNKRALTALQKSIRKWKRIAAGRAASRGIKGCALCHEFRPHYTVEFGDLCKGCPVMAVTGKDGCEGSPYDVWTSHMENDHGSPRDLKIQDDCAMCKEIAIAEYNFLRALLPERLRKVKK